MSERIIRIVPKDSKFIPGGANQHRAFVFLKNVFVNTRVEMDELQDVEFIDQGSNFDKVFCGICNYEIEIDSWQELIEKASENHFNNLEMLLLVAIKSQT